MVLEKETWLRLPPDTAHVVSFAGLVGDGAALIVSHEMKTKMLNAAKSPSSSNPDTKMNGFSHWLKSGNLFLQKLTFTSKEHHTLNIVNGTVSTEFDGQHTDHYDDKFSPKSNDSNQMNGHSASEEEDEDLLADFIDEDSQLPSRISKPNLLKGHSQWNDEESTSQTGSSVCLLRCGCQ